MGVIDEIKSIVSINALGIYYIRVAFHYRRPIIFLNGMRAVKAQSLFGGHRKELMRCINSFGVVIDTSGSMDAKQIGKGLGGQAMLLPME